MQIQFEVAGAKQLSRNLRIAIKSLPKMKEFHQDAIDIMEKKSLRIFKSKWSNVEKNPKWSPLHPTTKKARSRRWWYYKKSPKSPSTLVWTWNLKNKRRKKATHQFWVFEFLAKYAPYHQKWSKNLPRRALIDLDNKTNAEIVRALQKKVNEDVKIFWRQT